MRQAAVVEMAVDLRFVGAGAKPALSITDAITLMATLGVTTRDA